MSETVTMTLTEFLLACFAEDEADTETAAGLKTKAPFARDDYGRLLVQPARVLADIEAKRRIVAEHHPVDPCDAHDANFETIPCDTLRFLALPYADHPDYRPEWKP